MSRKIVALAAVALLAAAIMVLVTGNPFTAEPAPSTQPPAAATPLR